MEQHPIIEARNITVQYGERTILNDVSFSINRGEIFVIVGGSGCGKSTLLRQIIGLEQPHEGAIYINGTDFSNSQGDERRKLLKKFGVLFQSSGLFASMNLAENIALPLETFTKANDSEIEEMIAMKLSAVGLAGFQNFLPSEISGGMKKRAALARALALDPEILCFDEPSSGLDPVTAAALDNLIIELNAALGTTMIVVSHDLQSIFRIASRVIMLDALSKGIIATGSPNELRERKDNPRVYNFFNRIA